MKIVSILLAFAKCGCICQPICDPEFRHHSKRASIERRANKIILEIKVKYARYALAQVNQSIANGNRSDELEDERKALAKIAKKDISCNTITPEMIQLLEKTLGESDISTENEIGGSINQLMTGIYQDDLLIAMHFC